MFCLLKFQEKLGDIVYVQLPDVNDQFDKDCKDDFLDFLELFYVYWIPHKIMSDDIQKMSNFQEIANLKRLHSLIHRPVDPYPVVLESRGSYLK